MLLRSILAAGGTPAAILLYWLRLWCSSCIAKFQCTTSGACGALVQHLQVQTCCIGLCSKVRCLHLTVNSQWKLFTFRPKRSFGVKTVWNPAFGWISQLKVRIFPGRKAWKDALATQALRPELQKARPYGLAVESKRKKATNHNPPAKQVDCGSRPQLLGCKAQELLVLPSAAKQRIH